MSHSGFLTGMLGEFYFCILNLFSKLSFSLSQIPALAYFPNSFERLLRSNR